MKSILVILAGFLLAGFQPVAADDADGERLEYDVTWVGVSVAAMTIEGHTNEAGHLVRSLRIRNRPWLSLVYPVDTYIECESETTSEGPLYTIRKTVSEREFRQNDTLQLWPDQGKAFWSNAVESTTHWSIVPKGSRDLVTFFFDLREVLTGSPLAADGSYQLVMDGAVHDLDIEIGKPKTIRSAFGRLKAIPVDAISKSPTLFSRNRPKSVWVAMAKPSVLSADVETRFGPVRATLVKWEVDGTPVEWPKPDRKR